MIEYVLSWTKRKEWEDMENEKENRIQKILSIMENKLKVNPNLLTVENYDKPLTGKVFGFRGVDLTYLFFEVEKNFGIKIDTMKILNYEFNTINGIANLLNES